MKYVKLLAAAALALSLAACQSTEEKAVDEAEPAADTVETEDSSSLETAEEQDKVQDENGEADADYGEDDPAN